MTRPALAILFLAAAAFRPASAQYVYWTSEQYAFRAQPGSAQVDTVLSARYPTAIAFDADWMYWADDVNQTIVRSLPDGTMRRTIASGGLHVTEIAVGGGKLYWYDSGRIRRSDLDGSEAEELLQVEGVRSLLVDTLEDKLYWIRWDQIQRAGTDGSNLEAILPSKARARDLALDGKNRRLYWTDENWFDSQPDGIYRMSLDGGDVDTVVKDVQAHFLALTDSLYWIERNGSFGRSALDGSGRTSSYLEINPLMDQLTYDSGFLYWISLGALGPPRIKRLNLENSEVQEVLTGYGRPGAMQIVSDRLYWMDFQGMFRADLDGENVTRLVDGSCGIGSLAGIAVDTIAQRIYFGGLTDCGSNLTSANLDGSNRRTLIVGQNYPERVAVDPFGNRVYWYEDFYVARVNAEGGSGELLLRERSWDLALDLSHQKLYRTDRVGGRIRRSNLDGSDSAVIVDGLSAPEGIALDVADGKVYWAENESGKIRRANLDGTAVEDVLTGLKKPSNVALSFETSTTQAANARLEVEPDTLFYSNQSSAVNEIILSNSGTEPIEVLGLRFSRYTAHSWWIRPDTLEEQGYTFGLMNTSDSFTPIRISPAEEARIEFTALDRCIVCKQAVEDTLFIYTNVPSTHVVPIDFRYYVSTEKPITADSDLTLSIYPNPLSTETRITVSAAQSGAYYMRIFDILGREVAHEKLELSSMQEHTVSWHGDLSSGIYFVRVAGGGSQITKTVTVAR